MSLVVTSRAASLRSVLDASLASEAIEKALVTAHRLAVPERVEQAAREARRETMFPLSIHWTPHSLAQGHAGLALLYSHLDACRPNENWDRIGHEYLLLAAQDAARYSDLHISLFAGLTGVAFAAWRLSRGGTRYRRLLDTLDNAIAPRAVLAAQRLHSRHGVSVSEFDAISGLTGIGAYLLCRRDNPVLTEALLAVVKSLLDLCLDKTIPPRWFTPCHLLGDEALRDVYPDGCLNLGLAHGIPGPLAFLALAHREAIEVPGLRDGIRHIADWIAAHSCDDEWGINWPTSVRLNGISEAAPEKPSRCAWCYGSPGIARAMWLAGEALDCEHYRALAVSALEAVFRRPSSTRQIDSPTFCHGMAGLLAVTLRFNQDTGGEMFREEIVSLVRQILARFQPNSLLGFRNIEFEEHEIEQPGLLDGAPGVVLALVAAATPVPPAWDRLFLLS
ncbi:MAG TPA: lanthionine synthetase C family protein [Bryobacteraceae bacterium]